MRRADSIHIREDVRLVLVSPGNLLGEKDLYMMQLPENVHFLSSTTRFFGGMATLDLVQVHQFADQLFFCQSLGGQVDCGFRARAEAARC